MSRCVGALCLAVVIAACAGTPTSRSSAVESAATDTATDPPTSTGPTTSPSSLLPADTEPADTEPTDTEPTDTEPTAAELRGLVDDAWLVQRMADLAVPGVAVAIVRDGEVVVSFGVGTTPDGAPMTASTITQVGSVSKPVAAIAAAAMAADALLAWDDDIAASLTSYELPQGEQSDEEPVTLERLLSHTAGTNVAGFIGYPSADVVPDLPTVLTGGGDTEAVRVIRAPGGGYMYSGGGYELVEQVMLDVTGDDATFDELIGARVFDVAGMPDSFYALELTGEQRSRATIGSVNGVAMEQGWQRHPESAAAGLWTTADDLAALLVAFSDSVRGVDEELLPQQWARRMLTPVAPTFDTSDGMGAIGHGFFLDDVVGPQTYRHPGSNVGYTAEIAGTTDGRSAVAVVTNSYPGGSDIARQIIATTADAMGWSVG